MMPEGPVRCDACGINAVQRGGIWMHVDPQAAAQSSVGPHDPLKIDPGTVDYIRAVIEGGDR